jgi:methyltransferase OMS1
MGRKNYYERTDEIPKHVQPLYADQYLQTREYFDSIREKKPLLQRLFPYLQYGMLAGLVYGFVSISSVWIAQPSDLKLMRENLLQNAYGRVCELGAGHGTNIGMYPYPVYEIVMADTNKDQLNQLRYRIPNTAYPKYEVRLVDSEQLTCFKDAEFDCVVDMFGLCHLRDPVMALRQMQRIVKPTGTILLLEHGRSKYPWVNWFLDYYADSPKINAHGCHWNMPIADLLKESNLQVKEKINMHYGTTYYVVAFPEVLPELSKTAPFAAAAAAA